MKFITLGIFCFLLYGCTATSKKEYARGEGYHLNKSVFLMEIRSEGKRWYALVPPGHYRHSYISPVSIANYLTNPGDLSWTTGYKLGVNSDYFYRYMKSTRPNIDKEFLERIKNTPEFELSDMLSKYKTVVSSVDGAYCCKVVSIVYSGVKIRLDKKVEIRGFDLIFGPQDDEYKYFGEILSGDYAGYHVDLTPLYQTGLQNQYLVSDARNERGQALTFSPPKRHMGVSVRSCLLPPVGVNAAPLLGS